MSRSALRWITLFFLVLPIGLVAESGVLELRDPQTVQPAIEGLAWFAEGDEPVDLTVLLKGGLDERFTPSADGTVPLAAGPLWLRLRVKDTSGEAVHWDVLLDEWSLREIRLYRPAGGGDWEVNLSGTEVSESQREQPGRVYQFHLAAKGGQLRKDATHTVYLRVAAPRSVARLPVWVGSSLRLQARQNTTSLGYGMLAGAYLLLLVVCLVLFLAVVDRVYAIMTVFAAFMLVIYLGLTGMLIGILGSAASERLLVFLPELSVLFEAVALLLMLAWLKAGNLLPRAWLATRVTVLAMLAATLAMAFVPEGQLIRVKAPIMLAALLAGAVLRLAVPLLAALKGRRTAFIYLVAFSFEICGTTLYTLRSVGFMANDTWVTLAAQSGGAFQLLVMLYGTAILVRQLRFQLVQSNQRLTEANQGLEARVHAQTEALEQERNKLAKLAMEDDLTGLLSRRAIMARVEEEHQRFLRYGTAYTVLMIDLDHFKLVNDTWGHGVGDTVLKGLAEVLLKALRSSDHCGRIGGEEFLVLLPQSNTDQALAVSEKIRDRLADIDFEGAGGRHFTISCSIGVAQIRAGHPGWTRLLQEADTALYQAKESGRNRIVVSRQ